MNRRLLLLTTPALALALAGCASVPPPAAEPPRILAPAGAALAELEPLYLAQARPDALVIRVRSNGCTAKADFAFYVERKGEAVTLAFGRRKVDGCKVAGAAPVDLTFTWAELGLPPRTAVFLLNPLFP